MYLNEAVAEVTIALVAAAAAVAAVAAVLTNASRLRQILHFLQLMAPYVVLGPTNSVLYMESLLTLSMMSSTLSSLK
jgi:hypothetical protein